MFTSKNANSIEQAAEQILQDYLLRCYATVSKQYQPMQQMTPEQGVEYLLWLRDEGKLSISLYPEGDLVKCRIEVIAENDGPSLNHKGSPIECQPRGPVGSAVAWPVVLWEHTTNDVLVNLDAEGVRDLLGDPYTAGPGDCGASFPRSPR